MNLGQLQAAIQAKGYTTDTAAQQTIAINSTYRQLLGDRRWPFLEAQSTFMVTGGIQAYPLTLIPNFQHLDAVRLEDDAAQQGWPLENREPQAFRDLEQVDPAGLDRSTPTYWTNINQTIRFWPVPDQTYTARVDYIMAAPDLALSTDVPVFPAVYHDILVWGAVAEIAYRERDWLGRQFAQTEQMARYKSMEEEYLLRQRQTSSTVRKSGYWTTSLPSFPGKTGW